MEGIQCSDRMRRHQSFGLCQDVRGDSDLGQDQAVRSEAAQRARAVSGDEHVGVGAADEEAVVPI